MAQQYGSDSYNRSISSPQEDQESHTPASLDNYHEVQALDEIMRRLAQADSPGQSASGNLSSSQPPSGSLPNLEVKTDPHSVSLTAGAAARPLPLTDEEFDIMADLRAGSGEGFHYTASKDSIEEQKRENERKLQRPQEPLPQARPRQRPVPAPRRSSGSLTQSMVGQGISPQTELTAHQVMSQSVASHSAASTSTLGSDTRRTVLSTTSISSQESSTHTAQPNQSNNHNTNLRLNEQNTDYSDMTSGYGIDNMNRQLSGTSSFGTAVYKRSISTDTSGNVGVGSAAHVAASEQEANKSYKLYLQKAKLKEQSGKISAAIEDYKQALQYEIQFRGATHPEVVKTHCVLSRLYRRSNQSHLAVQVLETMLTTLSNAGLSSDARPDQYWVIHDALAQSYGATGKARKKIEHYELAISILSSFTAPPERLPHMHNNLGNSYRDLGDLNSARDHLEKSKAMMEVVHAEEKVEEMAKVHASLGDVYSDLQLDREAIVELEKAVIIRKHLNPGVAGDLIRGKTHKTLAALYTRVGDMENAARQNEICQRALQAVTSSGTDREKLLQDLKANKQLADVPATIGELAKLAAHITSSDDISHAQQCQKANDHKGAIQHYTRALESVAVLPADLMQTEQIISTLSLCHNNIGNSYRRVSKFKQAQEHLIKALELRRKLYGDEPNDDTASTLYNLGHLVSRMGGRENLLKTLQYHEACLVMYMSLGGVKQHMAWIVSLHRSLGSSYEKLENSRKSVEHYEKAKDILIERNGDKDELRAVYNNMGNSYESLAMFDKAGEYLNKSLDIAKELLTERPDDLELRNHVAACHNNLGVMYQTRGMLEKSLDELYKSRDIRQQISDRNEEAAQDLASSYHNIGNTLAKMDKYQQAIDMYLLEKDLRHRMGQDLTNLAVVLSHMYSKIGDIESAESILDLASG